LTQLTLRTSAVDRGTEELRRGTEGVQLRTRPATWAIAVIESDRAPELVTDLDRRHGHREDALALQCLLLARRQLGHHVRDQLPPLQLRHPRLHAVAGDVNQLHLGVADLRR